MQTSRWYLYGLIWLAFGVLSGCDDPSAVGIGLIDDQGLPKVVRLPADSLLPTLQVDRTGNTTKLLAGRVEDPLLGTHVAWGFVDFSMTRRPDTTIRSVILELPRNYRYGDTLATLTLALHDMPEEWPYLGVPADTTLTLGPLIRTFTLSSTDTLVRVELPTSWIAANDTTLRSTTFTTSFHGFALTPGEGNAIWGFRATGIRLVVITATDTLQLSSSKWLTTLQHPTPPQLPANRLLLQDGSGMVVRLHFPFTADSVHHAGLHAAVLEVPLDTLTLRQLPPHFSRPAPPIVRLVGVDAAGNVPLSSLGNPRLQATATPSQGRLRFQLTGTALQTLQRMLMGETPVQYLQLEFPTTDNTLGAVLLYRNPANMRPTLILTLTPPTP